MRIATYAFEDLDAELSRPPLAAVRALGTQGIVLSQELWLQLAVEAREAIVMAGAADHVDAAQVRAALQGIPFKKLRMVGPVAEPDARAVPSALAEVLGPWLDTVASAWPSRPPLDRFILSLLAGNPRLLWRALGEISTRGRWAGAHLLPTIQGTVARCDVRMGRAAREALEDPTFHDGRAGVLARASGKRAARRVCELIDAEAETAIGPVELEWGFVGTHVVWQAHASTATGAFSPSASLLAATTAAIATIELVRDADPTARIVSAGTGEEPWLFGGASEEATLVG